MYQQVIETFLTSNKIPYEVKGGQVICRCLNPKHIDSNPSFSFSISKGVCHCFSCGYKNFIGNLTDVKVDEETLRSYEYDKLVEQLHVGTTAITKTDVILPPNAFDITWEVRGISGTLMKKLGAYYCDRGKYKGRIIFPMYDMHKDLIGYTSWIATEEALGDFKEHLVEPERAHAKYLHSYGLVTADFIYPTNLNELNLEYYGSIHLCEGLFDALSLIELGYPAVCNFGLGEPSISKIGEVMALGHDKVTPAFDNDKAGIAGWQKIKDVWREYMFITGPSKILTTIWDSGAKDANEYLQKKLQNLRDI